MGLKADGTVVTTPVYHWVEEWNLGTVASNTSNANLVDLNGQLVADFGDHGLWYHDGSAWHWMGNRDDAAHMVTWNDGTNDILALDFGSDRNMYDYDGSWHWIRNANDVPEITAWDNALAMDFGVGVGVYNYNGTWNLMKSWSTAE